MKLIVTAGVPCERAGIAIEAMRHGKDVMADKPGCTSLDQLADDRGASQPRPGASGPSTSRERFEVRAVDAGRRAGRGRRHRPGRPDDRPRAAPARTADLRPGLVLRARAVRRHPDRHRLAPDRPVPVLHRLDATPSIVAAHGRQLRPPGRSGARGLRRDAARERQRPRLHPRRLVHAGRPADLGRRPADHPRHRGLHRAAQVRRHRRPAGRPTTCSWSTPRAPATSTARTPTSPTTGTWSATSSSAPRPPCPRPTPSRPPSWLSWPRPRRRAWATCVEPPPSGFRRGRQNRHRARRGRPARPRRPVARGPPSRAVRSAPACRTGRGAPGGEPGRGERGCSPRVPREPGRGRTTASRA